MCDGLLDIAQYSVFGALFCNFFECYIYIYIYMCVCVCVCVLFFSTISLSFYVFVYLCYFLLFAISFTPRTPLPSHLPSCIVLRTSIGS